MSNAIEIEAKVLVSEEDYRKLAKLFASSPRHMQTNYYIDTESLALAASGIALRIRERSPGCGPCGGAGDSVRMPGVVLESILQRERLPDGGKKIEILCHVSGGARPPSVGDILLRNGLRHVAGV